MGSEEISKEERITASKVLIGEINRLRSKVIVVSEPYNELQLTMNDVSNQVIPILQDYDRLQRENELLRNENRVLKEVKKPDV